MVSQIQAIEEMVSALQATLDALGKDRPDYDAPTSYVILRNELRRKVEYALDVGRKSLMDSATGPGQ